MRPILTGLATILAAALLAACASRSVAPAATPAAAAAAELPEGRGREILLTSCTWCHDLREVTKFRGFYSRAQWRDIVVTMVEYGTKLDGGDVEVLADYLTEHLGRRVSASTP